MALRVSSSSSVHLHSYSSPVAIYSSSSSSLIVNSYGKFQKMEKTGENTMLPPGVEKKTKSLEKNNLEDKSLSMDDIMSRVGLGRWTYGVFLVSGLCPMAEVINLLGSQFVAPEVNFKCQSGGETNFTTSKEKNCFVEEVEGLVQECTSFEFDNSTFVSTLTEEYQMVCSKELYRVLYQLIFTAGCAIGSVLGGFFGEKYGRQPTIWCGSLVMAILSIILMTKNWLWLILTTRFLLGVATMSVISPGFTIGMEVCPIRYRTVYGITIALPYALMTIIVAGIAHLTRSWLPTQILGSVPIFALAIFSSPLFLSESPRWVMEKGDVDKVESIIRKAATRNGNCDKLPSNLSEHLVNIHLNQQKDRSSDGTYHKKLSVLFSSSTMMKLTAIIVTVWFLQSSLYISLPLNANAFSSPFLYMALLGLFEIPSYTLTAPITERVGRKPFLITAFILTGILQDVLAQMDYWNQGHHGLLSMIFSAICFTTISSIFQAGVVFCSELFPTSVRALGTGMAFFASNLGFSLPPLLSLILPSNLPWLRMVTYSLFAYTCACLLCFLPETNRQPLLQTVEQYETFRKKKSRIPV